MKIRRKSEDVPLLRIEFCFYALRHWFKLMKGLNILESLEYITEILRYGV